MRTITKLRIMLRNTTKIHRLISNQAIFRICNHSKNFVTLAFNIHCWERKLYLTIHARQFLLLIQNFTLCQISVFGAFLAVTNRIGNITNLSSFYAGLVLFAICSLIYGFPFRLLNLCNCFLEFLCYITTYGKFYYSKSTIFPCSTIFQ